uniref:SUN domain-containing protein n=1 Tax=Elaeophora elaphi TaxID=1147741 RepID=A0A0R3RTQ3_9BILA
MTYDISPFKKIINCRFLSDYRFPVCSIFEKKECDDAASNDTRSEVRSTKVNSISRQSTQSIAKSIVKYEPTEFLENMEISGVTPSAEEIDLAVPFSSEQPPIVTFDEWTKEKLKKEVIRKAEQQQNHQHKANVHSDTGEASNMDSGAVSASKIVEVSPAPNMISQEATARNYASKECGAKVLFSNDEAENKNSILNEKEADDYMRNPCERAEHKWLIIELCETIQPTILEVANFELFSSGPQNIRILGSERYPSNEWMALGDFVVENNREIQRFQIVARSYVKFLRLELLSHYGREHYCTLSLVRLLGISMVDEYEAEAEAAAVSDTSFSIPVVVNSSTMEEADAGVVMPTSTAKEDVSFAAEIVEKNESVDDLPFVGAVVNAVGSIGIGNIKDVFGSTFLLKRNRISAHNIIRSNTTVVELCTKCLLDIVDSYVLFCRTFFGFQHNFVGVGNDNGAEDKEVHIQISVKNQKENLTGVLEFFLATVLPTYICDLESGTLENVQNTTSCNETESDGISTIPPTINSPTTSNLLNKKSGGGFMIPGGVISHKESIFLKLNKRISNLELNMSLSSEYLSELSRRYVLQTNESRRQAELIIKQAEEAAINAIKPSISALKIQMDALAASLRELTETVKALPQEITPSHRTMVMKHVGGVGSDADASASLARSQPHFHGYFGMWTNGELVCIVVFVNVLTLLILLLFHYTFTAINRNAVGQAVDEGLQKFIQEKSDIQSTAETYPEHPEQQLISTAVCDVTQVKDVYKFSLAPPCKTCLLTESATEENCRDRLQPMELIDRPSSQLSTRSEQNPWQIRKRKNKKRKRSQKSENLDQPLYDFGILASVGTE